MNQAQSSSQAASLSSLKTTAQSNSKFGLDIGRIVRGSFVQSEAASVVGSAREVPTQAEILFNAVAMAKIWTSKIAMHLQIEDRNRFFKQLDLMHDQDEWLDTNKALDLNSYKGFINFVLHFRKLTKPALALHPNGNIIALWADQVSRLTLEFEGSKKITWVISKNYGTEIDRAAGNTTLERLGQSLATYESRNWFLNE